MIAEEFSLESVLTVAGTFAVGVAICLAWLYGWTYFHDGVKLWPRREKPTDGQPPDRDESRPG